MRIVGPGAIGDLDRNGIDNQIQNSLTFSELALLDNGGRVTSHGARGFSGKNSSGGSIELAPARGIVVSADDSRQVRYEIALTERVSQRRSTNT